VIRGYIFLKRRAAPASASIGAYIISLKRWVCTWKHITMKDNKTIAFLVKCYVGEHNCESLKSKNCQHLSWSRSMLRFSKTMTWCHWNPLPRKWGNTTWGIAGTNLGEQGKQHWQLYMGMKSINFYCFGSIYGEKLKTKNHGSSFLCTHWAWFV
jgi:hypothetical protein